MLDKITNISIKRFIFIHKLIKTIGEKSSQQLRKPLTATAVMFCHYYIEFHRFIQRKISGFTK